MSTRAVVFAEAGAVEMRDVTLRELGADEVAVDTHYSSISAGTERLLYMGKLPGMPHLRYPLVPGYEAAGVVCEVGADVQTVHVGDEVFVGGSMCYTDVAAAFGGQSSRLIKKAEAVVPLHGIPLAHAPLLALAATSLHGVRLLGEIADSRIVILGMGAIGQLAAQFATIAGATVIAVDRVASRLADAVATEKINVSDEILERQLSAPATHAIEATGISSEIARCARAMASGGKILLLSYYDPLETPYVDLFIKEATLLVAREWVHADLLQARDDVAAGRVDLRALARHVVPIESFADAYRTAFEDPSTLKVVLQWA